MNLFVQPKELNDTEKKLFILKSYSPTFIKMNIYKCGTVCMCNMIYASRLHAYIVHAYVQCTISYNKNVAIHDYGAYLNFLACFGPL